MGQVTRCPSRTPPTPCQCGEVGEVSELSSRPLFASSFNIYKTLVCDDISWGNFLGECKHA